MSELDKIIAEMRSGNQDDYVLGLADRLAAYVEAVKDRSGTVAHFEGNGPSVTGVIWIGKKPEPGAAVYLAPQPPRAEVEALERDAARYRWLRERDLDTIRDGGVFAGMTPKNVVLNGDDLDVAIDRALLARREGGMNEQDAALALEQTRISAELVADVFAERIGKSHAPTPEDQRKHWRYVFAASAMQGLLANPSGPVQANSMHGWGLTNCKDADVAAVARGMADALLNELESKP